MSIEPGVYVVDNRVWIVGTNQTLFAVRNGGWVENNSITRETLTSFGAKKLLTGHQLRDALFKLAEMEDNAA